MMTIFAPPRLNLIEVVSLQNFFFYFSESFWNLAPDCLMVMGAEFLVDWIKHAFITRFNEVDADVYKSYTIFLAYDLAQTKQKHVSLSFILERAKIDSSRVHLCLQALLICIKMHIMQ